MKKYVLVILMVAILAGCILICLSCPRMRLQLSMISYTLAVSREKMDNVSLTIWYRNPLILFNRPLSVEKLKEFSETSRVYVDIEELGNQTAVLRELKPSAFELANEIPYVNATLHYELHWGKVKVLDVTVNQINSNAFVNGVEVKHDPVLYELIIPYLSEEDRTILGL